MRLFSLFKKNTPRQPQYEVIARTRPYYVDGVDIFDETNRKYIEDVCIQSRAPQRILQAKLYLVYGSTRTFKLTIAPFFTDMYSVAFLSSGEFRKACNAPQFSNRRNANALREWCLQRVAQHKETGYIYNYDNSHRALIIKQEKCVKVEFERLEIWPDADIDFPQSESEKDQYAWSFEHIHTSYYSDENTALKNINTEFFQCAKTID